ncbi:hypothetical protein ACLOJK_010302 [Asimina triloba]
MGGGRAEEQNTEADLHTVVVAPHAKFNRAHALVYACAILALFYHRCLQLIHSNHILSFSLFLLTLLADSVLAIMWAMNALGFRWRPVRRQEFPERLPQLIDHDETQLPAMDVFICTADPFKEPPLNVVNTALSVMAFEYPADKISVYVSDDGGSDLTLFAFVEAAKFATHWLPYCRDNKVAVRCPGVYLQSACGESANKIKELYESMKNKVDRVMERGHLLDSDVDHDHLQAFKKWTAGFTRQDHPTVIEVLSESSKDMDASGHPLPNLVYVSREKSRCFPHHFKAGALNVLLRVSATMTNAPVVLTLDCDMYSNDPQAPHRAMCYLLDPARAPKLAYVQFPQRFRGVNKNDIYGGEWRRLFFINPMGMDGLVGTSYVGTGCFFNRRALDGGPSPSQPTLMPSSISNSIQSESVLQTVNKVASCSYEQGTEWGSKLGMRYGSLVEDFYTGYKLHCEGWESVFCNPEKAAFLGDVPINLNDVLSQTKRWCVGLLEVFYSQFSPATFGASRLPAPVAICYTHHSLWSAWSVPLTIYAFLPQLALLAQIPLFPKISNTWCFLYLYLFIAPNLQDLAEFLITGGTTRRWWNDQRIWMMRGLTSYLFSLIEFSLKHMGISTAGFNVTNKVVDDDQSKRYEQGSFEFGVHSPMFVTLSTAAMINLIAFVVGILRSAMEGKVEEMCMQLLISGFVVLNAWPIYKGMVRRDKGRLPARTTIISVLLSWALCNVAYFSN